MDVTRATHDSVVALLTGSPDIDIIAHRMLASNENGNVNLPDSVGSQPLPQLVQPTTPMTKQPPPGITSTVSTRNNSRSHDSDTKQDSSSSSEEDSDEESSSDDEPVKGSAYVEYEMEPLAKATSLRNINSRVAEKVTSPAVQSAVLARSKSGQLAQSNSTSKGFHNEIEPQIRSRSVKKNISSADICEENSALIISDAGSNIRLPPTRMIAPPPISPVRASPAVRASVVQEVEAVATWAPAGPVLLPPPAAKASDRVLAYPAMQMKPQATSSMKRSVMNESVSSAEVSILSGDSSISQPANYGVKVTPQPPISPVFCSAPAVLPISPVLIEPANGDAVSQLFMKLENNFVTPPSHLQNANNSEYGTASSTASAAVKPVEPYPVEVLHLEYWQ